MPSRSTRGKPRGKRIAAIATIVAYIFIVIPYALGFPGAYAVVDRAAVLEVARADFSGFPGSLGCCRPRGRSRFVLCRRRLL